MNRAQLQAARNKLNNVQAIARGMREDFAVALNPSQVLSAMCSIQKLTADALALIQCPDYEFEFEAAELVAGGAL